ncbi:hypothetical protein [Clostridium sp. KNHs216]|jgi:hypothetical protein|uniref:hypothetical protein n=1 Tax=Clostridium sp. KNHs216 TaxID=1550235 RepID=UPI001153D8F3|nr:hypothetical protein [Clostridium sp. KNHs216]MBE6720854.1 hypothetical protein [Oscillospiraceae bacterium]TQI67382.1 hypothetical protein LY85_2071 [Clostridium sp. KNHs216]
MEKSGFFNSTSGDRMYDASDFAGYFAKLVSSGIFYANADNLRVTPGGGLSVNVLAGSAWINGYAYENTETLNLTIAAADGVNPRIDRVVVHWDAVERQISAAVLTGTAAVSPTAPSLTRSDNIYELALADIAVAAGAVSLAAGDITDRRLDTALCGTVNSLITAVYE